MALLGLSFSYTTAILAGLVVYLIVILAKMYARHRRTVTVLCRIPGLETEFLFGNSRHMPDLSEAGLQFLQDNCTERPRISVGWMGPFLGLVNVLHPDTVKAILKSSAPKSESLYGLVVSWLGEGLLISNGKKWHRSRRLLTPAFHFDILKKYMLVKNEASDVLVEKLQKFADQDVYFEAFSEVCQFSLDVILQCAFSLKSDCQHVGSDHPYIQAVSELNELIADRFFKFWLYPDIIYYMTANGRRWRKACNYVHKVAEDIIEDRRKQMKDDDAGKCHDFLGILLTARDDEDVGLTSLEIRNEVDTFLFEGHDTTTSGTSWALYQIAKHPDVQQRLHEEIDDILRGRESDQILWDDLPNFPYLTCVIKESMRINPPVPFIQRITDEPMEIDGYEIPKGTNINIVIYNVLNNVTVWEEPNVFNPDRFIDDTRDPFSYVPFSAGSRNCIGQNFAMNEMKTVIARVLRRFRLELDPDHVVARQLAAVMKSKNGIRMKAVPRHLLAETDA